jgi:hypothetical protein
MSDPRFRDPRLDPPPLHEDEVRSNRLDELQSSNAMWGWVAGAVALALVLIFVFTRTQGPETPSTAALPAPPAASTTTVATPQAPAPPSTTGQGTAR